jgi:hypothetical protein
MRKLPKEQHKKRIVFLIPPEQFELLTETRCKEVSKTAILKEYKKQMRS